MNPLALIPKSAYAVVIAMLMATSCSLHWDNQGLVVDIAKEKVVVADLKAAIKTADAKAAAESATLTKKVLEAQNAAKKREAILLADAKSANTALDGLRLSIATAKSSYNIANVPTYASTELTDTSLKLLDQCSERYTVLAATTDIYASYIQEVTQAWPVLPMVKAVSPE
jgi:hypothetical protein